MTGFLIFIGTVFFLISQAAVFFAGMAANEWSDSEKNSQDEKVKGMIMLFFLAFWIIGGGISALLWGLA